MADSRLEKCAGLLGLSASFAMVALAEGDIGEGEVWMGEEGVCGPEG
ncbi:MAG: hypothetical protein KC431_30635 [Myxococcales bacterium]|nr:hypothetical protein [Myxococcales bacterium]